MVVVVETLMSHSREEENREEENIPNLDFLGISRFSVLLLIVLLPSLVLGARGSEMFEAAAVAAHESSRTRAKVAGEFV